MSFYTPFHAIGQIINLGEKGPRPMIRTFTIRATLTRSIETKIGLSQRKKSKSDKKNKILNTAYMFPQNLNRLKHFNT